MLLETRFGTLAENDRQRLQAIENTDKLKQLFRRALAAQTVAELLPRA
ncbi:MAG: hypothetical protein H7Y38_08360 [Armatimonadetes bacterium]|nr:hypothetical protein [Armatimonadota bacterium]